MTLTLLGPENTNTSPPPYRFISTLFGNALWPKSHSKINGLSSPKAMIHVYSAETMLGLHQAPDMLTVGAKETKIDLEKLIRMALHQSVLAFEILAGPGFGDLDRQLIVDNTFTTSLVSNIDALLVSAEKNWSRTQSETSTHFNLVLARLALNEGIASTDVGTILDNCTFPDKKTIADSTFVPEDNEALFKKLSQIARRGNTSLPEKPKGYDAVSDYLVRLRLET